MFPPFDTHAILFPVHSSSSGQSRIFPFRSEQLHPVNSAGIFSWTSALSAALNDQKRMFQVLKNFIILNHESQGKVDYSDRFSQTNAHFSLFSKRRKKKSRRSHRLRLLCSMKNEKPVWIRAAPGYPPAAAAPWSRWPRWHPRRSFPRPEPPRSRCAPSRASRWAARR